MSLITDLLMWYDQNHRKLPWRATSDPYRVWLSEVILQQTRVEQGLPYYHKFVEAFKNVNALANAKEQHVLKLWQGLGYYSRGRNLHATSKAIVKLYKGKFPEEFSELKKLKGIGDYTAAAIASIAFNQGHAVVDGNVYRVLSRLFLIDTPINTTEGKKVFSALANQLLDREQPGKFNQAMMELGALVCKPVNPQCSNCPVLLHCKAYKKKLQNSVPVKLKKTKVKERFINYFVIEHGGATYLKQRNQKDIWQGLFDFPLIESTELLNNPKQQIKEVKRITGDNSAQLKSVSKVFKHQLTHQTIHALFIAVSAKPKAQIIKENNWIKAETNKLDSFALPRLMEKFLEQNQ